MTGLIALLTVMVDRRTRLGALALVPFLIWTAYMTAVNGSVVAVL